MNVFQRTFQQLVDSTDFFNVSIPLQPAPHDPPPLQLSPLTLQPALGTALPTTPPLQPAALTPTLFRGGGVGAKTLQMDSMITKWDFG